LRHGFRPAIEGLVLARFLEAARALHSVRGRQADDLLQPNNYHVCCAELSDRSLQNICNGCLRFLFQASSLVLSVVANATNVPRQHANPCHLPVAHSGLGSGRCTLLCFLHDTTYHLMLLLLSQPGEMVKISVERNAFDLQTMATKAAMP